MSRRSPLPCLALMLALVLPGPAVAQVAPAANPVMEAARGSFEALAEPDRKAMQEALIWTGDYSGMADGSFGRQTFDAIGAFQQRSRQPVTGTLNPAARTALLSAAQQARNAAGFTVADDPKSGVRIGVPMKLLPKQDANQSGGSRWQSQDGKVTLDTRVAPPDSTLQALYDRNLAIQAQGRVVTYKIIRPDFFVIAGETPTGKFYTRYAGSPTGIRAFSIGYDKALAPNLDRIVVAIANSFVPFPSAAPAPPPTTVAQSSSPPPAPAAQPAARRLFGTGLVTGPRQVSTTAPMAGCANPLVEGLKPQRVGGGAVTVLDFASDLKTKPQALTDGIVSDGDDLTVLAFADEAGTARLTAVRGTGLGSNRFSAPLQPGASGAPVLDGAGRLAGLIAPLTGDPRKIAGIVPAASYALVALPGRAGAAPQTAATRSTADIVEAWRSSLVPIFCN